MKPMRLRDFPIIPCVLWLAVAAQADISVMADKLDPSDGISLPPPHIIVVEIGITPTADDAFVALGVRGQTSNGSQLVYARDPNNVVIPSAPGTQNRFVSFFSRSRDRDADNRFTSNGRVQIAGRYCGGIAAVFLPGDINAGSFEPFPEFGRAGFVLRIALDLSNVSDPKFRLDSGNIVVSAVPPPNSITLFQTGCMQNLTGVVVASRLNYEVGFDFGVYGIVPEPGGALLLLAGLMLLHRQTR